MSRLFLALVASCSIVTAAAPAHAVAHHRDVVLQKLRGTDGKVSGFRVHLVASPEGYSKVRINVGKMALDPGVARGSTDHRLVAAGMKPGYVRAQLVEHDATQGPGVRGLHELKLDVHYGVNNDLKPGDKVDIFSTHSSHPTSWHVFGMFDGPVNRGDTNYVHELPSDTSTHGEATETP